MPSKQVTDREKSARAVVASTTTHASDLGSRLAELLRPYLKDGESMPDIALLTLLVGRAVEDKNDALVAADEAHEAELADDAGHRRARDEAAEQVRATLVDLRSAVNVTHGSAGLQALGIDEAVSYDPSVLATAAAAVHAALGNPKRKLPPLRRPGITLNRPVLAAEVNEHLAPLSKALDQVAKEAREAETTFSAKHAALSDNDHVFSRGARWLSASFALAGMDDIAGRVRPSGRRPGRTAQQEDGGGEDAMADAPQGEGGEDSERGADGEA